MPWCIALRGSHDLIRQCVFYILQESSMFRGTVKEPVAEISRYKLKETYDSHCGIFGGPLRLLAGDPRWVEFSGENVLWRMWYLWERNLESHLRWLKAGVFNPHVKASDCGGFLTKCPLGSPTHQQGTGRHGTGCAGRSQLPPSVLIKMIGWAEVQLVWSWWFESQQTSGVEHIHNVK